MANTIYDMIDLRELDMIIYSETDNPHAILGARKMDAGIRIMTFIPRAKSVEVLLDTSRTVYPMEKVDEAGVFACLLNRKTIPKYKFRITYDNDTQEITRDPYFYKPQIDEHDMERFDKGIHYEIYEKLGAHIKTIAGDSGVYFAVWAPAALRVSVVGDFNLWDGRRHQMRRLGSSGIHEIFIPGLKEGEVYKYEVKTAKGEPVLKADPYAFLTELRPNNASKVYDLDTYVWNDKAYLKERLKSFKQKTEAERPLNIYELHLGSWKRKEISYDEYGNPITGSEFYNYRELAPEIAGYVKKMGYTHIEIMPIMEHPLDQSWGYQVTGYYSPTSRYGTPQDFMYFVDYMHGENIGIILDWVPAHFPKDLHGLGVFDGSHLYEHADKRQGEHPHWGTLIYNYGRPEVSNFLIANALYWARYYHIDGIRMDAVASMLYLDYGKNDGEWVANCYGGNENLEAIEFLKHLNSIFKKNFPDALLIAEESTAWPKISGDLNDGGLGFDYKWNMGWMNDFLRYMRYDPIYRSYHYGEITFSMMYQYSEKFVLVLSHDEVVHGKGSLAGKMPGATFEEKLANLRAAYGFMMTHPGKKLLFMGQEFAQFNEWNEGKSIEWELLDYDIHKQMHTYSKALNQFYMEHPALYQFDSKEKGFEWVNCYSYEENILAFIRRGEEEELFVVCNFTPVKYENFEFGLDFKAKFKEIFNSDTEKFGGSGMTNSRMKTAKKKETAGKEYTLSVDIAPMSTMIFKIQR